MPLNVVSQAEVIPGYRLLEPLGRGGFGEVWKAEAPGGLHKAVKILHGNLLDKGAEPGRINQELMALNRVRTIRHPYILSLERFEIVEGRLIIVMELADKSLWDRFQECRGQGLPGIPRQELLRYMEETAEALDLMNGQFNLQHLDIKPQNLFLLFNHVKIGDFGLVRTLEGMQTRISTGVTPVYAAPETFEGIVSRFCDQYNLGVVYQELLTGQLPFDGNTGRQLMLQHTMSAPNLQALPVEDQPAVARALAKKPEERHPSCMDFVQALRRNPEAAPATAEAGQGLPASGASVRDSDSAATVPTRAFRVLPKDPVRAPGSSPSDTPGERPLRFTPPPPPAPPPPPPERPETTGAGVLCPSVVIGLGGLGRAVQQQLRKALGKRGGPAETWPHIRLLHVDTDPQALEQSVSGESGAVLSPTEILLTFFQRPSYYMRRPRERQQLEEWLPLAPLARLPRDQVTAGGWRALGRLAFVSCASTITGRLREELEACIHPEALAGTSRRTGLGLRSTWPRVYVVTSLTGGTGSGMFIDLAYALRRTLVQLGLPRAEVIGVLLVPAAERSASAARAVANAFAALTELNHYAAGGAQPEQGPPFSRCVLLPLPAKADGAGALAELTALAGDYLCRELTTPLGRVADLGRADLRLRPTPMPCQTFATYWFSVPRRPLLQCGSQSIGDRLVRTWQVNDAKELHSYVESWVADRLTRWELSPECLAARLTAGCAALLEQEPAACLASVMRRWGPDGPAELSRQPTAIHEALAELERPLGAPQRDIDLSLPSPLMKALVAAGRTLAEQAEDRLADVPLRALVEPRIRFSGAEEAVQRQLWTALGEAARRYKVQSAERHRLALDTYQKLQPLIESLQQRSGFLRRASKAPAAASLMELFKDYLTARWESALFKVVSQLCQDLQSSLHKYLRTVECCRGRLRQFLKSFADPSARANVQMDLGLGRYLLPAGCHTLDEAVSRLLASLTPDDEAALHEKVRILIGEALLSHVHVCTAPATFFMDLKESIDRELEQVAQTSLGRANAAEVYLEQHAENPAVYADLADAFDQAQPELSSSRQAGRQELCILAAPADPEGERFRALVRRALPETRLLVAASTDDILFYREHPQVMLTELPQMGPAAREVYQQVLATEPLSPHSRSDIAAALPAKVASH
jgi:serine/threonine protein kinase